MVPPTKRWLVATTTAVLATLTGCSAITGGSAPSAGSGVGGGGGACGSDPGFCITVDITGATTVQGTSLSIHLGSCADYAKGESINSTGGGLVLPGLLGEDYGGRKITAANEIRKYDGPGTYEKDMLKSVAGVIDVSIDNTPYQPAKGTTAQAVINADGSGSFTFTDLNEGEQGNPTSQKGVISGSITWTCTD